MYPPLQPLTIKIKVMRTISNLLRSGVRSGWNVGLDFLFPIECVTCSAPGRFMCRPCLDKCPAISQIDPKYQRYSFDSLFAVFEMTGVARRAVHALKYRDLRAIAPVMGNLMADVFAEAQPEVDLIIPMALHPTRTRRRGYNQAELLARTLSKRLGVELDSGSLRRVVNTPPLVDCNTLEERQETIAGAFECGDAVEGRRVLLVDDVVTSGSTCDAAADELKNQGASFVHVLSFALEV